MRLRPLATPALVTGLLVGVSGAGIVKQRLDRHHGGGHRPVAAAPRQPRAAVQLPDGVPLVSSPSAYVPTTDVLGGTLAVPSGRLVVDDFFYGDPQVRLAVPRGRLPVRLTLARFGRSDGAVALATVVAAPAAPVRWRLAGVMTTDGGTGCFGSQEASDALAGSDALHDDQLDALEASRGDQVAPVDVGGGLSVACFSSGLGDGSYGVFAGADATGRVTRVVFDAGLLRLGWEAIGAVPADPGA